MKIGCIMWSGYIATMAEAARELDFLEMNLKSLKDLEDARKRGEFLDYLENEADVILVLHSGFDGTLDEILSQVKDKFIISFGYTASHLSPEVSPEQAETIYRYLRLGGVNNLKNALLFIAMEFFGIDIEVEPPAETPWDGIYHPRSPVPFYSIEDYIEWYGEERIGRNPTAGLIFYKTHLVIDDLEVEDVLIKALEGRGLNVIPVFSWGFPNKAFEIEGNEAVIEKFFMRDGKPIIDLLID
ncbi:MAG: cobaltochelatase subunit CobN, partial [Candidatus Syntropharchaeales archaeon]